MRKVKVLLVGILTLVLSLICLTGCFLHQGKYKLTGFTVGNTLTELEDSDSYIELKGNDEVVVSVSIDIPLFGTQTIQGEGTWTKGAENGSYILSVGGVEYNLTIEGSKMTLDLDVVQLIFEK